MKKFIFPVLLVSLVAMSGLLDTARSQGFRTFKIGSLWDTFHASSAHIWQLSWDKPFNTFMVWPANRHWQFDWRGGRNFPGPVNASASSYWIGAKPWTDHLGQARSEHVSEVGWWFADENSISIPVYIKKVFRQVPPEVRVDGLVLSEAFPPAANDELDPNLVSDQMIENAVRTDIGVDILQRAYAYTNANFDNIILVETVFKNTGNVDLDEEVEIPGQVLSDVYFDYSIRPTISREGHNSIGSAEWRAHEFGEYYGADPGDSLKLFYSWDGDNVTSASVEDLGDPHPLTGHWLSAGYLGVASLHADASISDQTNAPDQPSSAQWAGFSKAPSTSKGDNGIDKMYEFMTFPHKTKSWEGSGDTPPWEGGLGAGDPNWHGENQLSLHMAYGPYQMQSNDDWRLVYAKIMNGLSEVQCRELGAQYKAAVDGGNPDDFSWTNPTTGQTFTGLAAKSNAIATGRDSVFKSASRAKFLYENNFNVPDPPMSPSLIVNSAGGGIEVAWSNEPASEPDPDTGVLDFEGYRLYRAIGRYDSTHWEMIYEGTDNTFFDEGTPRGVGTYYYCTAFDDGTQNTTGLKPGQKLESSKHWNLTTVPAFRLKAAENSLSLVEVVPNPYNIRDPNNFPGEPNKLLFVNLTQFCTITIYTMTGEKVRTLEHTSGSSDEAWDQITDENQYVVSGIYIYHVQRTDQDGLRLPEEKIGKFVIVR
jgi:hypothetical protein